jgi:predicted  nucleic acid-binding Zn-ribbon protein
MATPSSSQIKNSQRTLAHLTIPVQYSSVREQIQQLLVLQERDQKLLIIARDLERIPRDEAHANSALAGDQAALAKAIDTLRHCEVDTKKVELDIATRKTTILRLRQQQFETRKNEEYTALGNEVIRYEKEIDRLETTELEFMEKADELRLKVKEAEAQLKRSQTLVNDDLADLANKKEQLLARKQELQKERSELSALIDAEVVPLYERLMKGKNGSALVQVAGGLCCGCHMKLVPSTLVKVLGGVELTQCENCGRILYPE